MKSLLTLGFAVLAMTSIGGACDDPALTTPSSAAREPLGQVVEISGLEIPVSSCKIVDVCRNYGAVVVGAFDVVMIDEDSETRTAELQLARSWGGDLPATMRFELHRDADGTMDSFQLSALNESLSNVRAGDELGLVFGGDYAPCWGAKAVFRQASNGGFTNGRMFTTQAWNLNQIGEILLLNIEQKQAGEPCFPNIHPDDMPEQPAFDEAGVPGPPACTVPIPDDFDPDGPPPSGGCGP